MSNPDAASPICPGFNETQWSSVITEIAVPLVGLNNEQHHHAGTAIMLTRGFAMTAWHVFEWAYRHFAGERMEAERNSEAPFALQVIQTLNEGRDLAIWDVRKAFKSPYNDIAFLKLYPTSRAACEYAGKGRPKLSLFPPQVGAQVFALGYPTRPIEVIDHENHRQVALQTVPMTSTGFVRAVHENRRDTVRMPFPCFQTNARFDDGMSGGPVFDSQGRLCGLVCASLPPTADGEEHVSYVTTLWPSMATLIDLDREHQPTGVEYPFIELVQQGFIQADGHERIAVFRDEHGTISVSANKPT